MEVASLANYGSDRCIEPAGEVSVCDVAHEQEQTEGGLIESAVSECRTGQGARAQVPGPVTGLVSFAVTAAVERPIALELAATQLVTQGPLDLVPSNAA